MWQVYVFGEGSYELSTAQCARIIDQNNRTGAVTVSYEEASF